MTEGSTGNHDRNGPTPSRVSGLHSRTFEMELLVSGALVFGLLHLPGRVDAFFETLAASYWGNLRMLCIAGEAYVQLVLYALLTSFVLHLGARAFWIGLVGLESVFPEGIRWDRIQQGGPLTIDKYRRSVGSLARAIDRLDDACSLIFSFGFLIALTFIYSVIMLSAAALVGFAASPVVPFAVGFGIVLGLIIGVQVLAGALDKRFGGRLDEGSLSRRILVGLVNLAFASSPMRWIGHIMLTLGTNLSSTKFTVAFLGVFMALGLFHVGTTLVSALGVRLDSLIYFPDSLQSEGVDPRHYRTLRPPDFVDPRFPSIQSDLVDDDYLKLVLPYHPGRLTPRIEKKCPDLDPLRSGFFGSPDYRDLDPDAIRTAAACLGGLFEIQLDGVSRDDLIFDFSREPGSGLAAVVTYIRVADLAPGRHELEVLMPGRDPKFSRSDEAPPPIRHLIPFWV